MDGVYLEFGSIPKIGFAHHFRMENYKQNVGCHNRKSLEIVYTKEGSIIAEMYDKTYNILPGSILVLLRNIPLRLYAPDSAARTHCSLELVVDFEHEILWENAASHSEFRGFLVPFINPPCQKNEELKKKLFAVVSDVSAKGGIGNMADSVNAMSILSELDSIYRENIYTSSDRASVTAYKIKAYIADRIQGNIPLEEIAEYLGKTPGYLNSVFHKSTGVSIHQYISKEKVRIISELILERKLSFKEACESMGIEDVSYGYRLFKKQTGLTPGQFASAKRHFR